MKIALLTDGIQPYVTGGMQRHSFFIAKYLSRNGIFVDLYHTWQNKEHDIHKLDVFTFEEKKYIRSFVIDFPEKKIGLPGHYLRRSYKYSEKIYDVLKNNLQGVDFIYVKGFSGWKLLEEKGKDKLPSHTEYRSAAKIPSNDGTEYRLPNTDYRIPPIGIKFHGLNMFQKPPSFRGWLEQLMLRPPVLFNLRNADYVFSYGGKITDITRSIGVPDTKIIEIPTGIESLWLRELPATCNQQPATRFLYVGRYERLKGIGEISKAIINLSGKHNFQFHFAGPIPEKLQLRNREVKYWGQVTDTKQMQKIIDSCDVLLLPSYSEGMPNAIIEAMSRGLAIIATDVGAVNCLVDSANGWLLEECSVNSIQEAMINAICTSDVQLMKMKQISLEKIRQGFLWEGIAEKLIEQLNRIVDSSKNSKNLMKFC